MGIEWSEVVPYYHIDVCRGSDDIASFIFGLNNFFASLALLSQPNYKFTNFTDILKR
jgi:hypothetical protein